MDKKVSIISGLYNCAKTLPEAIDSIIRQTYTNWELILCDDCSTDETYKVAEEYQKKHQSKIKLIKNKENMYLAYCLNHCLQYATGYYIARMDGDDISKPDRLMKQITFLETHPDIQLVGTAMQRFDEHGTGIITYAPSKPNKYALRKDVPYCHATILTYKSVYDKLGGYTVADRTKRGQDYDLWFRFYAAGYVGDNIQEALYMVREDKSAIRRRTFSSRWSIFKTTLFGYRLLNFPRYWLLEAFFKVLYKSLMPFFMIEIYRKLQNQYRKIS